jgi:hypothetical protein
MKTALKILGFIFGVFNTLPLPWRLRVLWMRFLYDFIFMGTNLFPSILSWTNKQNSRYKMGKQQGEDYESLVLLERVLQYFEKTEVPIPNIQQAVTRAEAENVPPEKWGAFLAQVILGPLEAERVLKAAFADGRY